MTRSEDRHLFDAAQAGQLVAVQYLLKWDANPNWGNPDADGETALHAAVFFGESDIVRALIAAGGSATTKDQNGRTPLHTAAMRSIDQVYMGAFSSGVQVQELQRDETSWSIVQALLAAGADVWAKDKAGDTALHLAAHSGRVEVVEALLKAGADTKIKNRAGKKPMDVATSRQVIDMLLPHDMPSPEKQLFDAAMSGDLITVQHSLKAEVDCNWQNPDQDDSTPLHAAAFFAELEVVRILIASGARIMARDREGKTPLHATAMGGSNYGVFNRPAASQAASSSQQASAAAQRHDEVAKVLLAAGADVWAKDKAGDTALHLAASAGRVRVVQVLLKAGAEVTANNAAGQTALDVASDFAVKETLKAASAAPAQAGGSGANEQEEDEQAQCIVCMGAPRQYAMIPCGHCVYCKDCADAVAAQRSCALCRQTVERYMRVYLD